MSFITCNKRTCYTIDKIMKKQMSKEKKEHNIIQKNTSMKKHMQLDDETNRDIN